MNLRGDHVRYCYSFTNKCWPQSQMTRLVRDDIKARPQQHFSKAKRIDQLSGNCSYTPLQGNVPIKTLSSVKNNIFNIESQYKHL